MSQLQGVLDLWIKQNAALKMQHSQEQEGTVMFGS